ncbi:MAG: dihydrodipicolinate synthase family protein [Planctomycetota bacterium]
MKTGSFDPCELSESVIAVPPLCRNDAGKIEYGQNARLIKHLESGGVRSLLYGGNAVLYHTSLDDLSTLCANLVQQTSPNTTVTPAMGPSFGAAMDQIEVLRQFDFPTVMLLPSRDIVDSSGIAQACSKLADRLQKPIVLYLKYDQWMDPVDVVSLERDGVIAWIKYAVVRDNPEDDDYLRAIMDSFPRERMVSGIGEQPAIIHVRDFQLAGYTSGCVCVAPEKSMMMMKKIQACDWDSAEELRGYFRPLEDLRDQISPIRVLHEAVELAGIAKTGLIQPMLSRVDESVRARIISALTTMNLQQQ